MIEPNMATMLSYIFTDFTIEKKRLQSILTHAVNESFNSISVDGSESTSDTVVALSSNQIESEENDLAEFESAILEICQGLASDIVRNGEGTSHVMRIDISNYPGSDQEARMLGRSIANSALLKCAIAGNDPNTGRLASAIGSFLGRLEDAGTIESKTTNMIIKLGGRTIFKNGKFVLEGDDVENELSQHMIDAQLGEQDEYPKHQRCVEIGIDFGTSTKDDSGECGNVTVLGSDLTAEYVSVNADYRS
uniref:Arginine biosynthesis bifunctional protein ArgJ, mitochondrial n=1 Tax=Proboscia inermis TaxID=420281 RepID=A0A7S0GFY5_9STRA|mmetsp:Transcript_37261/g.37589  ORF Transcript_37261/g.37589 Transcript_37261/m.37589 type:complete len:249 (+) Transcript_37261:812-1558(+)